MNENDDQSFTIQPIGFVTSCFVEKFGTPRQSGLAPSARSVLELVTPFHRAECVRGLATFSHIWLQFLFHQATAEGWKTTIRPPRLDGRTRKGVFATRSPHRPNHIGLSVVELRGIEHTDGRVRISFNGGDLLNGTPVIDIKPYIARVDCRPEADRGWLPEEAAPLPVQLSAEAAAFCRDYEYRTGRPLAELIREVLSHDPRPAHQRSGKKEFGMRLWDVNIRWRVEGDRCLVGVCRHLPVASQDARRCRP